MSAGIRGSKIEARGAKSAAQRPPLRSHRDLDAYRRSMDLLVRVHEICRKLPADDRHDLANHMRRASKSIPADIAEGFGRKASEKDFKQYMKTAMASASDMEAHLELAGRLGYARRPDVATRTDGYSHVGTQLNRLIANWRHF